MRRYLLRPWMSALLTLVCCVPLAHGFAIDVFTADGEWCPMAHCNRLDNSFQEIAPLLTVGDVQEISAPNLSPMAHNLLGCVSGPKVAICAYNHPDLPAVAALDPVTGNVLWTSPLEDLPEARQGRNPAGLLLARLGVNGNPPKRYVYTGNAHEFVAYHALTGRRVWKRKTTEITPAADEIGAPVSFSYTDNKELVTVTSYGWVVKLNPVNGETIDAYRMKTAVPIDGRLYGGVFITKNSPAIAGNRMYLTCEFVASPENPLPNPDYPPIYVVRVELGQHEGQQGDNRITPVMTPVSVDVAAPDRVAIGVGNAGGSPSAMVTATGSVLVVADASVAENGGLVPAVVAVEDIAGELKPRWRMVFSDNGDKIIVAAPALYAPSKTLLVNTNQQLYVVRDIDKLSGQVVPPEPLTPSQLLGCVEPGPTESLLTGSPMGVAFSQSTNELIVYTNVRLVDRATEESHGYLVAFAIPAKGPAKAAILNVSQKSGTRRAMTREGEGISNRVLPEELQGEEVVSVRAGWG